MVIIKSVIRLALQSTRQLSSTTICRSSKADIHEGYFKLKELQAKYQKPDGLPVHLKRGARDRVLYYTTVATCFVGLAGMGKLFYDLV